MWHSVTSTFVSRGRRGAWSRPPSFCVAGVALVALGWLWCHTPSLSHTIFHTLSHTPSLTHPLSHTIFVTHTHKPLSGQVVRNHRVAVCMPQRSTPWCRHSLHDCWHHDDFNKQGTFWHFHWFPIQNIALDFLFIELTAHCWSTFWRHIHQSASTTGWEVELW